MGKQTENIVADFVAVTSVFLYEEHSRKSSKLLFPVFVPASAYEADKKLLKFKNK